MKLSAVAVAAVAGAGVAFTYVATGGITKTTPPADAQAAGHGGVLLNSETPQPTSTATTPTTTAAPPENQVLPFNAKLTTDNIPVKTGGVRSGACSGSLIAREWILTAGHCFRNVNEVRVSGKPPYTMKVVVGKLKDSDPGGHTAEVVDVRQSKVSDLAVVKLSEPVDGITPVSLGDSKPSVGLQVKFAGWGSLSSTVLSPSDHLKRGDFKVVKVNQYTLEAEPMVPRTVENSPCPQDSGAPFFVSDDDKTGKVIAIVNTGPSCPQPGREIIARVDAVADWIREQTG
ncbi:trypsin-like serine protease [Kibdelosporangium philippinense]|uniref:Trypsin-like serine protease n=1 Tax=Kibdelosporangium philippinense TaxID=211113 RepID=A0ABS8ZTS2_9PSEU|nr:trypsin-like serine protease [Kibdelosporangium philippinense]MCE7011002.1 trypsin-like serine protease [Kibdelosporangium philippinense]